MIANLRDLFVNIPDVTSSASNVIIQRGVGTSTNGVAAFGASVNIIGRDPEEQPYFSTQNSVGSFNTHKHSFEAGTGGLLNGKLSFMGRYSIIKSDGYIDRAFRILIPIILWVFIRTEIQNPFSNFWRKPADLSGGTEFPRSNTRLIHATIHQEKFMIKMVKS